MADGSRTFVKPPRLRPGDRVRFVSPASTPQPELVQRGAEILTSWGLEVEVGPHAFDRLGHYLAGSDRDRLRDLNDAFLDPGIRAIFATTGGKGAYRIVEGLDFEAARRDPKPLVGFSEVTILHLALLHRSGLVGIHGPMVNWPGDDIVGPTSAELLKGALMTADDVTLSRVKSEPTAGVIVSGTAHGPLIGGNLDMMATAVGASLPSLEGAIVFLEDIDKGIGRADRALSQLLNSRSLRGVAGVALGQFTGYELPSHGRWTIVDVLRDRLGSLGVPVLGGLPIGHGPHPPTLPIGSLAVLDADAGTLTVRAGVC